MPKFIRSLLHALVATIAFLIMLGVLFSIAYFYNIYTPPAAKQPPLMVISGATLIDGTGRPAISNATIVIGSDRILSVQRGASAPTGAQEFSVGGMVVMPALLDTAVYFEVPVGEEVEYLLGQWAWEITRSLPEHRRNLLQAGVTVVQDLGSGLDTVLRTRSLLQSGELAGPTLLTGGPILTAPGVSPCTERYPRRLDESTRPAQTPAEGRQWVQALAGRGVNSISVCYTSLGGDFDRLGLETLTSIIQEAHNFGLRVAVRTTSLEEARQATQAGADALVGGVTLTGEQVDGSLLQLMEAQGTVYIPTLAAVQAQPGMGPESLITAQQNAHLVHQAGVVVAAGSGTAGPEMAYGRSLQRELELLVAAGLTPAEALRSATLDAATLLGMEADRGTVEEGKLADLLILAGNPLDDLAVLKRVQVVVQNGVVVINALDEP